MVSEAINLKIKKFLFFIVAAAAILEFCHSELLVESEISAQGILRNSTVNCGYRDKSVYILCANHIDDFRTKGLAILNDFLTQVTFLA